MISSGRCTDTAGRNLVDPTRTRARNVRRDVASRSCRWPRGWATSQSVLPRSRTARANDIHQADRRLRTSRRTQGDFCSVHPTRRSRCTSARQNNGVQVPRPLVTRGLGREHAKRWIFVQAMSHSSSNGLQSLDSLPTCTRGTAGIADRE